MAAFAKFIQRLVAVIAGLISFGIFIPIGGAFYAFLLFRATITLALASFLAAMSTSHQINQNTQIILRQSIYFFPRGLSAIYNVCKDIWNGQAAGNTNQNLRMDTGTLINNLFLAIIFFAAFSAILYATGLSAILHAAGVSFGEVFLTIKDHLGNWLDYLSGVFGVPQVLIAFALCFVLAICIFVGLLILKRSIPKGQTDFEEVVEEASTYLACTIIGVLLVCGICAPVMYGLGYVEWASDMLSMGSLGFLIPAVGIGVLPQGFWGIVQR